jgi:hypothetical protein
MALSACLLAAKNQSVTAKQCAQFACVAPAAGAAAISWSACVMSCFQSTRSPAADTTAFSAAGSTEKTNFWGTPIASVRSTTASPAPVVATTSSVTFLASIELSVLYGFAAALGTNIVASIELATSNETVFLSFIKTLLKINLFHRATHSATHYSASVSQLNPKSNRYYNLVTIMSTGVIVTFIAIPQCYSQKFYKAVPCNLVLLC